MRNRFIVASVVVACLFAPLTARAEIDAETRAAAEKGDAESQFRLGVALYYADGAEQDAKAGLVWLRKAAAQGHGDAQFTLGQNAPSQSAEAMHWYDLSARSGSSLGQFALAEQMIGFTAAMTRYYPDAVEILDLLEKSAAQGNPQAMNQLGDLYVQSLPSPALQLVKLDVAKAREWYARAAEGGWPEADAARDALNGKTNGDFEPKYDIETFWNENPALQPFCRQRAQIVRDLRDGKETVR
ncbi:MULTISPECIES: tetratricopeptide repeat protein [Asticcacaulis]|uniref:tetratricopeptide repeat protein n=1 Tax=Asticcacaulis TaxID=76890 RepID=UPI001AE83530|nr:MULTISPECIES: tetratricopeptide repeat protein [Asticcacaulis]MBP2161315.1 TPR repeat protein [Asticcacaulis solisilvae]MDR6802319.1 TPR repeat protein [Asticcacaulis sp. BE141]